ncbi:hypothetical protein A4X06_0g9237, partial [Tilletia controversa]
MQTALTPLPMFSKPWKVRNLEDWIRPIAIGTFVATQTTQPDYIQGNKFFDRLNAATLDDNGRFMAPNSDGVLQELRFSYAAKGKVAYAFNNGKTGTAFPSQWASEATRPSSVVIETCHGNANMRRKRTTEGSREYTINVKKRSNLAPCSVPVQSVPRSPRSSGECYSGTYSGKILMERAIFVTAGEALEHGRPSEMRKDHNLARTIGDEQGVRYNTVPAVTVLDTEDHEFWKVSWQLAHELPSTGLWEIGFHVRAYKSRARNKVGFGLVLESLVLPGVIVIRSRVRQAPQQNISSLDIIQ